MNYKIVPVEDEEHEYKDEFMKSALCRVKDEYEGWIKYKKLYKEHHHDRYRIASKQEFGHLLMAIEDFTKHGPDMEEATEFNNMISGFSMKGVA
mgnify:CR=1 FL=1